MNESGPPTATRTAVCASVLPAKQKKIVAHQSQVPLLQSTDQSVALGPGLALPYWNLTLHPQEVSFAGSTTGTQQQDFQAPGLLHLQLTYLTLFCWACSWLLCLMALLPVWAAAQGVQRSLPRDVKKWVWSAVGLETVLFASFGWWETLCGCCWYHRQGDQLVTGHLIAELGYCALSLISKTGLTLLALQSLRGQASAGWLPQPG